MSAGARTCTELSIFQGFGIWFSELQGYFFLVTRPAVLGIYETQTSYPYHVCAVHPWCSAIAREKLDDLKKKTHIWSSWKLLWDRTKQAIIWGLSFKGCLIYSCVRFSQTNHLILHRWKTVMAGYLGSRTGHYLEWELLMGSSLARANSTAPPPSPAHLPTLTTSPCWCPSSQESLKAVNCVSVKEKLVLSFLENLGFGRKTLGLVWSYKTSGVASCSSKGERRCSPLVTIHIFSLQGLAPSPVKKASLEKVCFTCQNQGHSSPLGSKILHRFLKMPWLQSKRKNAMVLSVRNSRGIWALHFLLKLNQKTQNFSQKQI